jgi:hypothetical protein
VFGLGKVFILSRMTIALNALMLLGLKLDASIHADPDPNAS